MIGDRFVSARTFGHGPCIGCYDPLPDDRRARKKIKRIIRRARRRKDNMCKKYFLLFSVFYFCLLSVVAFGEGTQSVKEQGIALSLNLSLRLDQSKKDLNAAAEKIKSLEKQLIYIEKKSDQRYEELLRQLEVQRKLSEQLIAESTELSKLLEQSENYLKRYQIERDIWRGVAIGVMLFAAGYVVGDRAGWW